MDPPSAYGCCCRATLLWILPTFRRGLVQPFLAVADTPLLDPGSEPLAQATTLLPGGYAHLLARTKGLRFWPTIGYFLARDWRLFLSLGLAQAICQAALTGVPLIIELFLDSLQELESKAISSGGGRGVPLMSPPARPAAALLLCLLALFCANAAAFPAANYLGQLMAQRASSVLLGLLACKATLVAREARAPGEAQNALSKGAYAFGDLFTALHASTWAPVASLGLGSWRLISLLGAPAALSALTLMAAAVALSKAMRQCMMRYAVKSTDAAGQRYALLGEALDEAAALKALGWEGWTVKRVERVRAVEQGLLRTSQQAGVVVDAVLSAVLPCAILCALLVFTATHGGHAPTPTQAFATVTWLTFMGGPLNALGNLMQIMATVEVKLGRVQNFLALAEAPTGHLKDWDGCPSAGTGSDPAVASAALLAVEAELRRGAGAAAAAVVGRVVVASGVSDQSPPPLPLTAAPPPPLLSFSGLVVVPTPGAATTLASRRPYVLHGGELGVWCGPTGCGKTRLVCTLGGEAPCLPGSRVALGGRLMLVPQVPWLQVGTVRENIVGVLHEAWAGGGSGSGSGFHSHSGGGVDEAWYATVLQACCLDRDIGSGALPLGDATPCGDVGRELSGGQKVRIALARAVFCGAAPGLPPTLFVLDDPLASVGDAMGRDLLRGCIHGLLVERGHGVVLATKMEGVCGTTPGCDLTIGDGGLVSYSSQRGRQSPVDPGAVVVVAAAGGGGGGDGVMPPLSSQMKTAEAMAAVQSPPPALAPPPPPPRIDTQVLPTLAHLLSYGSAMGWAHGLTLLSLFSLAQALGVGQALWLRTWVQQQAGAAAAGTTLLAWALPGLSGAGMYGVLGASYTGVYAACLFLLTQCTLHASGVMHSRALRGVLLAPLPVLEGLCIGAVLARFEVDVDHLDNWIRPNVLYVLNALYALGGTCVILALASPLLLLWLLALCGLYYGVLTLYRKGVMALRALDASASSPLTGLWREVCSGGGASILRSSGPRAAAAAARRLLSAQGTPMQTSLAVSAGAELAADALFCLGASILFAGALSALILTARGAMGPADAGLLLSSVYAFPNALKALVVNLGWLEMSAVSCARLAQYAELEGEDAVQARVLPRVQGAPAEKEAAGKVAQAVPLSIKDLWVAKGGAVRAAASPPSAAVAGAGLSTEKKYGSREGEEEEEEARVPLLLSEGEEGGGSESLPPPDWVFQGLTLTIPAGAKVAVVGPSGSGKSTLFKVLLRLWAHGRGAVVLGSQDLTALPSAALVRQRVAALPQGGLALSGSVLENLLGGEGAESALARDDFHLTTQPHILARCKELSPLLHARILASGGLCGRVGVPAGLHHKGSKKAAAAAPWSAGERMLLSLARLLLRQDQGGQPPAALLLLDELSSEVDAVLVAQLHALLLARPETLLAIEHREASVRNTPGFTHVLLVGEQGGPTGARLLGIREARELLYGQTD